MDINGYLDLVPSENSRPVIINGEESQNKFMRFLESILSPVVELQDVVQDSSAFDVQNAAGNQLDIIGEIVGIDRELPYVLSSGTQNMTDDEYTLAIRLRIAQELWQGTNKEAVKAYSDVLGDIINISFEDNLDCTITLNVDASGAELARIFSSEKIFLVPAGVFVDPQVNDEPAPEDTYYGAAVESNEYEVPFYIHTYWENGHLKAEWEVGG